MVLLALANQRPSAVGNGPIDPANQQQVALGEQVYVMHCAACHGVELEGEPDWKERNADGSFRAPPHDETGHTWHHGDPTLVAAVQQGGARLGDMGIGSSNMPAYEGTLSDEEITAVLAYIKSTWPSDIQALQQEATVREQAQQ